EQIAKTLLKQVQTLKINKAPATLSIGMMTTLPTPDMGLEGFLEGCDRTLQQAKSDGGNCVIGSST
ncbi:MAG: hypothetical protein AAFV72_26950, partial [Cyanobacteria bacterium J06635_1]